MTPEQYIELCEKYFSGLCTPDEEKTLMQYKDSFIMLDNDVQGLSTKEKYLRKEIYYTVLQKVNKSRPNKIRLRWYAAAAILLIVGTLSLFYNSFFNNNLNAGENRFTALRPIKPGTNKATLTLADGSTIVLDAAADGLLSTSGKTTIKKIKNGLLSYTAVGGAEVNTNLLNTISVPRGGQYSVVLPDGTTVWLNSESSLTYPVAFSGSERTVTLKGEGYFEVVNNKKMPFRVLVNKVEVKVLGTHFNIAAYPDDHIVKTTLLEGSVLMSNQRFSSKLLPGEQAIAKRDDEQITKKSVNVNRVIAWKSGYFVFKDDSISEIMKQISRWYDVKLEYQGNISNKTFGGIYSKNKDINELLNGLELTELIHFKIEGRRIIVMSE